MPATPDLNLLALLRRLAEGGVNYVVIGGVAVAAHGYGRSTKDLDITYATDDKNLAALGDVLIAAEARLRGVAEDVPFVPDGRTLRHMQIITLDTVDGGLDLLVDPDGAAPYESLYERSEVVELDGFLIRIVSLDDLLAMKRAAGRLRDLADIEALEVARRQVSLAALELRRR